MCLVFSLLLLKNSKLFESLASHRSLFKFSFSLAVFSMFIQNLKKVFANVLRWVELLILSSKAFLDLLLVVLGVCRTSRNVAYTARPRLRVCCF